MCRMTAMVVGGLVSGVVAVPGCTDELERAGQEGCSSRCSENDAIVLGQAFAQLDKDLNGVVAVAEIRLFGSSVSGVTNGLTSTELNAAFQRMDSDTSGDLTLAEFTSGWNTAGEPLFCCTQPLEKSQAKEAKSKHTTHD